MKTALLASVSALALATSAAAADLAVPYKAPPPVILTWTGFYLGVEGGFAQNYTNWNDLDGFFNGIATHSINKTGGIAGGYAGYNWQDGSVVLGIETDFHWVGAKATQTYLNGPGIAFVNTATQTGEVRWLGSTRLRAGLDFQSTLFYFTGGVAYGNVRDNITVLNGASLFGPPAGSVAVSWNQDKTRVGWTAGFGVEHMFANWVARAEARYTDLGNSSVGCTNGTQVCTTTNGTYRADFSHTLWTGMVGLAYKF
jgi:outer membrane immunogenic protein